MGNFSQILCISITAANLLLTSTSRADLGDTGLRFSPFDMPGLQIENGVNVPDAAQFPMPQIYFFAVGPRVLMTATHVVEGLMGGLCPSGQKVCQKRLPLGGESLLVTVLIGSHYYSGDKYPTSHADFGVDSDWALLALPKDLPNPRYLSLDFTPLRTGETIAIVGKGRPYNYLPGFSSRAAAYEVRAIDGDSGWLTAKIDGRYTNPGDSGSPWMRVAPNGTVTVVGAHSTGNTNQETCTADKKYCFQKYSAGLGVFHNADDRQAIEDFVRTQQMEVCGVNRVCEAVNLPVPLGRLLAP